MGGVESIIVRDNSVLVEIKKLADKLETIEANQENLQKDITQIKDDVKPETEPV